MTVISTARQWPSGVITHGRLVYERTGPNAITLTEPVELFGSVWLPAGYESDGVSAPNWAALTIQRFGKGLPAALVHDARYDPPMGQPRTMTRREADTELYRRLKPLGFGMIDRWKIWIAVRVGGGRPWRNNPRFKS